MCRQWLRRAEDDEEVVKAPLPLLMFPPEEVPVVGPEMLFFHGPFGTSASSTNCQVTNPSVSAGGLPEVTSNATQHTLARNNHTTPHRTAPHHHH